MSPYCVRIFFVSWRVFFFVTIRVLVFFKNWHIFFVIYAILRYLYFRVVFIFLSVLCHIFYRILIIFLYRVKIVFVLCRRIVFRIIRSNVCYLVSHMDTICTHHLNFDDMDHWHVIKCYMSISQLVSCYIVKPV